MLSSSADNGAAPAPTPSTSEICPLCKAPAIIRNGRFGPFVGCSRFPQCTWTKDRKMRSRANPLTTDQQKKGEKLLAAAFDFVRSVGGIWRARQLLNAMELLGEVVADDVVKEKT